MTRAEFPSETSAQIEAFVRFSTDALAGDLVGIYLHGSSVGQGLQPQSDLDLLLVTAHPLTPEGREQYLGRLLTLSAHYPNRSTTTRCLDVLAVTSAELQDLIYPASCQFIYGEWLRQGFEEGEPLAPLADPVVTLLLAQAWHEAQPVWGSPFKSLAHPTPQGTVKKALLDSLPNLLAGLIGDERNVLLTLARMWRTAVAGDFVAKDVAARWAASRLPEELASTMADLGQAYCGNISEDWQSRHSEATSLADAICVRLLPLLVRESA